MNNMKYARLASISFKFNSCEREWYIYTAELKIIHCIWNSYIYIISHLKYMFPHISFKYTQHNHLHCPMREISLET